MLRKKKAKATVQIGSNLTDVNFAQKVEAKINAAFCDRYINIGNKNKTVKSKIFMVIINK